MHQNRIAAMTRKIKLRINLLRYNQSADVSDAALNHAAEKTAMPAPETITLRTVPKTEKTPTSTVPNRTTGEIGKIALINRP